MDDDHDVPRRTRLLRVFLLLVLCTVIATATGGVARAYWSGSGGGTGSGTSGTAKSLTLSPGTPTEQLYPTGLADVVLTVSNPGTAAVRIGSLALDTGQGTGGFAVDDDHSGCGLSALGFTTQTNAGAGWTVPAESGAVNGTLPITLTDALSMDVDATNACQGAVFTVYLLAGP